MRRLLAVASLAAIGCDSELAIPSSAEVRCQSDAECLDGFRCNEATGLCVSDSRDDLVAPTVISTNLDDAFLALGETATLTVTINEAITEGSARVFFNDGATREFSDLSLSSESDGEFVYTAAYTASGAETEGAFAMRRSLRTRSAIASKGSSLRPSVLISSPRRSKPAHPLKRPCFRIRRQTPWPVTY
ncbi:MAG: hypothetical protein AAF654_12140 [Myxococcota bacterium]